MTLIWTNLVVHNEALDQDLGIVTLGRTPELLILEFVPTPLIVSDPQKRNFHSSQKFVFVVLVFVVDGQLQDVVNVLHVTEIQEMSFLTFDHTWGLFHKTFFFVNYGHFAVNYQIFAIYEQIYGQNLAITTNP